MALFYYLVELKKQHPFRCFLAILASKSRFIVAQKYEENYFEIAFGKGKSKNVGFVLSRLYIKTCK